MIRKLRNWRMGFDNTCLEERTDFDNSTDAIVLSIMTPIIEFLE
jgi:hypothetical protein